MEYPGITNSLTITQRYTATFTCSFELYSYPFDAQTCSIDLTLPPDFEGFVEFSDDDGNINYTGRRELALFVVEDMKFSEKSGGNTLIAQFVLNRRQGVILLATFLPSVLLLSISWVTLFVKIEALNVRAIMSLTTLLVLYTLFANLSSSLPKTAEIKLIDIWFFFIIFVLFCNIMVHIIADRIGSTENTSPVTKFNPKQRNAWAPKRPSSERILALHRYFIVPSVFIIFSVLFWWQVFK
ncbi:gamma-aminobutyric acid receptor subunit delta-like [Homarus americanus]|uniref:gamma-aminobutyric acid receptor subunit delta-like n=1 Tax=Homarus americanus TaxID=6706 RepID=UPI001C44ED9E|nr:gamma-aminobutyric acid receptor subunit delta-like [Homarus americanus]XP_042240165.1 gamma-aminobutyric acid receptor subunit delta-like [Homarus americanus]